MTPKPTIFFSYAWGDDTESGDNREAIVDKLYKSLIEDGYQVIRDKNDIQYKGLFSELTKRMGRGKFIVVAISDKYLKSANCMSELLEIYRKSNSDIHEMSQKIFPIVLDDAKIHDPKDRVDYLKYWEGKKEDLNAKVKGLGLEYIGAFTDELRIYNEITSIIPILSTLLKDINTLSPALLSADNFAEIKNAIVRKKEVPDLEPKPILPYPIPKTEFRIRFRKKLSRWQIIMLLGAFFLAICILFFAHVSSTEIVLDLSISEANFRLPKRQVLTNVISLSSIGASGFREVQLPADYASGVSASTVQLSVDTNKHSGSINLPALALPAGVHVGIRLTDIPGQYRLSFKGKEIDLPIDGNGLVEIRLRPHPTRQFNFLTPKLIHLQSGLDEVNLDLNFLPGSKNIFSVPILADSLSLLRIDQHFDDKYSVVRIASTILSGTIYFSSSDRQELRLLPGQQVTFNWSEGDIKKLELKGDHISFVFHGRVIGMTTGEKDNRINLMPTYLEWLRARLGLTILWGIIIVLFALILLASRWRKI